MSRDGSRANYHISKVNIPAYPGSWIRLLLFSDLQPHIWVLLITLVYSLRACFLWVAHSDMCVFFPNSHNCRRTSRVCEESEFVLFRVHHPAFCKDSKWSSVVGVFRYFWNSWQLPALFVSNINNSLYRGLFNGSVNANHFGSQLLCAKALRSCWDPDAACWKDRVKVQVFERLSFVSVASPAQTTTLCQH